MSHPFGSICASGQSGVVRQVRAAHASQPLPPQPQPFSLPYYTNSITRGHLFREVSSPCHLRPAPPAATLSSPSPFPSSEPWLTKIPPAEPSAPAASSKIGLCGLPGVTSPTHFRQYWRIIARPRLDALLRAASLEPPGPAFLGLLDRLLAELRNSSAPAQHAAARHVDPAWREAAAEVAEACAKYETFVFQAADDELMPKLQLTAQRLAAQLGAQQQQQQDGESGVVGRGGGGEGESEEEGGGTAQGDEVQRPRRPDEEESARGAGMQPLQGQQLEEQQEQELRRRWRRQQRQRQRECEQQQVADLRRLLQLCRLLRRSFRQGGAGLEDEGGLGRLYAVRTAPSGVQERLSRLLAAEREAVAAVAAAVAAGPGPLAVPLGQLRRALQAGRRSDPHPNPGSLWVAPRPAILVGAAPGARAGGEEGVAGATAVANEGAVQGARGAATANATGAGADNDLDLVRRDPILGPMLAAAAAVGVPVDTVGLPLTPANLRAILRRHPCAAVRRAAYEGGLVPRLGASLQRLGAVAAVRREVAAVQGYSSFADYSYSRAGLAVSDAGAVLELLEVLAEALGPVAAAEVRQLQEAMRGEADSAAEAVSPLATTALHQQIDDVSASSCSSASINDSSSSSSSDSGCTAAGATAVAAPLPHLAPWDVEYAQALVMRRLQLPPDPSELEDYLHLDSVLYGISDLLYDMMGVRLEPTAAAADGGAGLAAPEESWDPRVVRLTVWSERGLAGVVYLDPGTGYGTRQLRFPSGSTAAGQSIATAAAAAGGDGNGSSGGGSGALPYEAVPAVSVGLQWEWRGGRAESPSALHELLHELGHALHLVLSSEPRHQQQPDEAPGGSSGSSAGGSSGSSAGGSGRDGGGGRFMHWGGLQLPLDVLEVPSSLLQTLAYEPAALARICRRSSSPGPHLPGHLRRSTAAAAAAGSGGFAGGPDGCAGHIPAAEEGEEGAEEEEEGLMPAELCSRVAAFLVAENCGGLAALSKVLASLVDQLLHAEPGEEGASPTGADVGAVWQAAREAYGALPGCPGTLRELAALPALAHHQATFHSYMIGLMAASSLRLAHPRVVPPPQLHALRSTAAAAAPQPPRPTSSAASVPGLAKPWEGIRRVVFEAGGGQDPGEVLEAMLSLSCHAPPSVSDASMQGLLAGEAGVDERGGAAGVGASVQGQGLVVCVERSALEGGAEGAGRRRKDTLAAVAPVILALAGVGRAAAAGNEGPARGSRGISS